MVDICTDDPGKEADLFITADVRTLVQIWEGDLDIRTALEDDSLKVNGLRHLIRTMPDWFGVCIYSKIKRGDPVLLRKVVE